MTHGRTAPGGVTTLTPWLWSLLDVQYQSLGIRGDPGLSAPLASPSRVIFTLFFAGNQFLCCNCHISQAVTGGSSVGGKVFECFSVHVGRGTGKVWKK